MKQTLTFLILLGSLGLAAQTTLIPFKSTWKYLDDGSDQGTAWSSTSFSDDSWKSGAAELGYGDVDETTVVSYGPDPNHKYITTYFRKTLSLSDPGQYSSYEVSLLKDDGAVVYVNGVEVQRSDMPTGTITYTTQALPAGAYNDGKPPVVFTIPASAFVAGTNVIAVEVHQNYPSTPDMSFDLQLNGSSTTPEPPPPSTNGTTLIPFGSVWRYLDNGSDQGTAWSTTSFSDDSWKSGAAELGYGDGDEATVVSYGPDPNHKYITTYFRKTLSLSDPGQYSSYEVSLLKDDGAVVYVNGVEVQRSDMPTGTITYTTQALPAGAYNDGKPPVVFTVPASAFVAGTNVIAVEVHQNYPSTPDMSFDLQLNGSSTTPPPTCDVPSGLAASNVTSSSATLSWTAVSGASSYNIQYRPSGTTTWTTTTSAANSVSISALSASTQYEFQVQTQCSGSTSAYSASATFTTLAPPPSSCGVPSGLTATNITTNSATLSWTAVSGASSYNIHYRPSGTTTWTTTTSAANSVGVSSLSASTQYEFQVQTVCSGSTSAYSASASFTTQASTTATVPRPDHVVILILENRAYTSIIGSSAAPRINALANDPYSALFTQSYGITHPSQPNYLHLYSGSNQGVTDNNVPANNPFTTPNLGRELIDAGLWFATYSEDLPYAGYNGATYGAYVRKHNPVTNWMGTGTNQVPTSTNQPFTAFPTDFTKLPAVSYVVPNQNNNMHDGSISAGDTWMYNNLNNYIQWAKTHNSLFILTFDEDDGAHGNRIVTIFTGAMVAAGQYSNHIDHHNVLRTIEDMYGLPHAGSAATATPITNCWKTTPAAVTQLSPSSTLSETRTEIAERKITVFPNPAQSRINFNFSYVPDSKVVIRIHDMSGRLAGQYELWQKQHLEVNISALSAGTYSYELLQNNSRISSGVFLKKDQ